MVNRRIILIIPFLISFSLVAQQQKNMVSNNMNTHYIDSSECELKIFASEIYYKTQISITDSAFNKTNVDYFTELYFQNSNYDFEAINLIIEFASNQAKKIYESEELYKCLCYKSSLVFFNSPMLNEKILSLRKYLR